MAIQATLPEQELRWTAGRQTIDRLGDARVPGL